MASFRMIPQLLAAFAVALGLSGAASAQSLESIKNKGSVLIGVMVDFPPYGLTNQQGEPEGFDIDVAKELAKRMGVKAELVPVSGPNRIAYLQSGRVDMLVASLGITPERAQQVDFSIPYERLNLWLVARKELNIKSYADLAGHTFGVARGNTADLALTANAPAGTNILRFDDDASTRQAMRTQQVDGSSGSDWSMVAYEQASPGVYERKFPLNSQVQAVAFRKDGTDVLPWVNDTIAEMIKDGSLEAIRMKWIGQGLLDLTPPK